MKNFSDTIGYRTRDLTACSAMILVDYMTKFDRLCGLVVRVSGYRYRGPGFDPDFLSSSGSGTGSTQPSEVN